MFNRHFAQCAVAIHLPIGRWLRMNHAFLHCSQHPPRRRVTVVCPVRSHSVVLTKPDPLTIVVATAQRELEMTRHFAGLTSRLFDHWLDLNRVQVVTNVTKCVLYESLLCFVQWDIMLMITVLPISA